MTAPLRITLGVAAAGLLGLAFWLWTLGGMDDLSRWAAQGQRTAQDAMARGLRALRAGEPAALTGLLGVCFAYGFFHAAGPGHGKILIGGYGVARRVALTRLCTLAVVSSLAQALTAIALVLAGVALLNASRVALADLADLFFAAVSMAAIALVGLYLALRGLQHLRATQDDHANHGAAHHHHHHEDGTCASCGHAHSPDPQQALQATSLRSMIALVAAIAVRPCTGAIFLLLLTWRMDILTAGILGTLAMALGTATVTLVVAFASVTLREGLFAQLSAPAIRRAAAWLEIAAGLVIALVAGQLLLRLI